MSVPKTRIMYIERGGGLAGPGRIGRVTFSKTGRTVYYRGRRFASFKGGYKTNHFDEETRENYWLSGPRKDGHDTFYPGEVEIDDDVRGILGGDSEATRQRAPEIVPFARAAREALDSMTTKMRSAAAE